VSKIQHFAEITNEEKKFQGSLIGDLQMSPAPTPFRTMRTRQSAALLVHTHAHIIDR
jgi:hypothetical protein